MGLPVAVPAATSAFGATAATSIAAAPALMTAAAPLSGAMFTGSFVSPLLTNSAGIGTGLFGGGGLLSGFSLDAIKPFMYGASVLGQAYSNIQQAKFQSSMYEVEQLRVAAETETKRLNAELDSVARLRRLKAAMATNLTQQYAGGVAGLDSSRILETVAQQEYGKDYKLSLLNIENEILRGNVQSNIYDASAKQVVNNAALDSAVLLGTAAYQYEQLGLGTGSRSTG